MCTFQKIENSNSQIDPLHQNIPNDKLNPEIPAVSELNQDKFENHKTTIMSRFYLFPHELHENGFKEFVNSIETFRNHRVNDSGNQGNMSHSFSCCRQTLEAQIYQQSQITLC